jgi:hypothetical protein
MVVAEISKRLAWKFDVERFNLGEAKGAGG